MQNFAVNHPVLVGPLGGLLLGPILAVLIFQAVKAWRRRKGRGSPGDGKYMIIGVVLTIVLCCGGFKLDVAFQKATMLINHNGQAVAAFPEGTILSIWDPRLNNVSKESYESKRISATVGTKLIVDNLEIRDLGFSVELEAAGTPEDYMVFRKSDWFKEDWYDRLYYHLYQFQNRFLSQLAGFYNPMDSEQQRKFKELLTGFLQPYLEGTGIRFKSASFRRT